MRIELINKQEIDSNGDVLLNVPFKFEVICDRTDRESNRRLQALALEKIWEYIEEADYFDDYDDFDIFFDIEYKVYNSEKEEISYQAIFIVKDIVN